MWSPIYRVYGPPKGYSDEVRQECLKSYVNGMGFRAIERDKGFIIQPIIYWVKTIGQKTARCTPNEDIVPEVGELDELETFIGSKKQSLAMGRQ